MSHLPWRGLVIALTLLAAFLCGRPATFERLVPAEQASAPVQTPSPALATTSAPTRPPALAALAEDAIVFVPRTGKRYHAVADCGTMRSARATTVAEAEAAGYTPCGVCWEDATKP